MGNMTKNGVSTTNKKGTEQYGFFLSRVSPRKVTRSCQYDYRDEDGVLFSTIKHSLRECREERNKWLVKRGKQPLAIED